MNCIRGLVRLDALTKWRCIIKRHYATESIFTRKKSIFTERELENLGNPTIPPELDQFFVGVKPRKRKWRYKTGSVVPPFQDPDIKRKQHRLTRTTMEPDPMIEAPEWSYADGRPAPLGSRQKYRMIMQMNYAKQIVDLLREVDFAVDYHSNLQKEKEDQERSIIEGKLEEKGKSLYQKSDESSSLKSKEVES